MTGSALERRLRTTESIPVIMDGGMGTTLEDRGIPVANALWASAALLGPEGRAAVECAHRDFLAAGAEILIANTHNASLTAAAAYLGETLPEEILRRADTETPVRLMRAVNRRAVECLRRATRDAPPDTVLAAGIGSPEGAYATSATLSAEEVEGRLELQASFLLGLGIEALLFETLTTETEIAGVARLCGRLRPAAWGVGLTCGEEGRTLAGVSMEDAWRFLGPARPSAVFVQCTPYDRVLPALEALRSVVGEEAAIGVYANDGRRWEDLRWHGDRTSSSAFAAEAVRWRDAGAAIIGGCCGTGPEHVAEMRRRLRPDSLDGGGGSS